MYCNADFVVDFSPSISNSIATKKKIVLYLKRYSSTTEKCLMLKKLQSLLNITGSLKSFSMIS